MNFFLALLVAFTLAVVLGRLARGIGLPRVFGYLVAGLILGAPVLKSFLFDGVVASSFQSVADFGVILLFFFAGLELSIKQFSRNLKESISISLLNTALPFVAVLIFAIYSGLDFAAALVLGLAMSVSSQAIIVDLLDELGLLKGRLGSLILSAGSVDDIVEMFLVAVVIAFVGVASVGVSLPALAVNLALFALVLLVVKLAVLPIIFRVFESANSPESLFGFSLLVAFLMAVLSNILGLGALIGALVAGILVRHYLSIDARKPWEEHKVSNDIHLIGFGFLIPLFFVWVGYNTDIGLALANPILVLVLFVLSFVLGAAGTYAGVRLNKGSKLEGLIVALGLSVKGDAELAVSLLALQAGIISQQIFSVIVVIALISTVIPPLLFNFVIKSYPQKRAGS